MKVLVSVASKHGATKEIGDQVAETLGTALQSLGVTAQVDVRDPEQVRDVASYDAAVLGSGIYAGHWLEPARTLVEREAETWRSRPVWLVSSGPLGDPPKPEGEPPDGARLAELIGARGHQVLSGRLERASLGRGERLVARMVKAPDGDFRDWGEVDRFAGEVAEALAAN
ncbi:MAG TPA: flavodoxin domain-containing protein [Jiangellales bacterium]|nr:flavodoxin domain-containing protein [Jiangellales bacterium]